MADKSAPLSDEIFEISDFTVISEWEKLVVRLETLVHEWQLTANDRTDADRMVLPKSNLDLQHWQWQHQSDTLTYSALSLTLSHWRLCPPSGASGSTDPPKGDSTNHLQHLPPPMADCLNPILDFHHASLTTTVGIVGQEFLCVTPVTATDVLYQETQWLMVLSAVNVALANTECLLPTFVQQHDARRRMFVGVCQNRNVRADMHTVHLKQPPPKLKTLSGLLDMFRQKVACPIASIDTASIKVSVRLTYSMRDQLAAAVSSSDQDLHSDFTFDQSALSVIDPDHPDNQDLAGILAARMDGVPTLTFGICQDPISCFLLLPTWPNVNEDMVVENEDYTDLDPVGAPYWSIAVAFQRGLQCLMHNSLSTFVNATRCRSTVTDILGSTSIGEHANQSAASLDRLTDQSPLSDVAQRAVDWSQKSKTAPPLDEESLKKWLNIIFDVNNDGLTDASHSDWSPKKTSTNKRRSSVFTDDKLADTVELVMRHLQDAKSAPLMSLCSRLSVCICTLLSSPQGLTGAVYLWRCVIDNLRGYWLNEELIPGIPTTSTPDHGSCLLHQKLVMLQCCIVAKRKRNELLRAQRQQSGSRTADDSDADSDDAFFDCVDNANATTSELQPDAEADTPTDTSSKQEPIGRSRAVENGLRLLNHPDRVMFVPVTQEPSPMTEDMLDDFVQLVDTFGAQDADASSRLHSDSLHSDMQAFKAANPGCCLEDFVRWHSPRDWIEPSTTDGGQSLGHLSTRMADPTNLWHQVWANAKPVPVTKQKRLFNESKLAEQILHLLSNQRVDETVFLLLPSLFHSALHQLCDEAQDVMDLIGSKLTSLALKFRHASRHNNSADEYRDLLNHVHWVETAVGQYRSLHARFDWLTKTQRTNQQSDQTEKKTIDPIDVQSFVRQLMTSENAVPIFGAGSSPLGACLRPVFFPVANKDHKAPQPVRKEYTMRWFVPRPSPESRRSPQRLYVSLGSDEFRMTGLFSQDILLM